MNRRSIITFAILVLTACSSDDGNDEGAGSGETTSPTTSSSTSSSTTTTGMDGSSEGAASTGGGGGGEAPVIEGVTWTQADGCVMGTGSEVTVSITASDADTDAAMLMYETSAIGCTTQSDGAETILLCPQVATYSTTVTVTDPEGNDDSIMFSIGICTDGMAP